MRFVKYSILSHTIAYCHPKYFFFWLGRIVSQAYYPIPVFMVFGIFISVHIFHLMAFSFMSPELGKMNFFLVVSRPIVQPVHSRLLRSMDNAWEGGKQALQPRDRFFCCSRVPLHV